MLYVVVVVVVFFSYNLILQVFSLICSLGMIVGLIYCLRC